jgi:hypothetical protein
MKKYPDQIKMLRDLRDSKSITDMEYQEMLEILLKELHEHNDEIKEPSHNIEDVKDSKNIEFAKENIKTNNILLDSILLHAKSLVNAAQIYTLVYGCFLVAIYISWIKIADDAGFWEQFIFFTFLSFLLSSIYESKITSWCYINISKVLNTVLFSDRKLNYQIHVDDPVYLFISDPKNADAQRVLNKIIRYFILYRYGTLILYKILVTAFIDRIVIIEKIIFFETNNKASHLFYYELLVLLCIKLYLLFKALNSGNQLKKALIASFTKEASKKMSELNPQLQFFVMNEQKKFFGPFSTFQIKTLMGLKLISNETHITNGYGSTVDRMQFLR